MTVDEMIKELNRLKEQGYGATKLLSSIPLTSGQWGEVVMLEIEDEVIYILTDYAPYL